MSPNACPFHSGTAPPASPTESGCPFLNSQPTKSKPKTNLDWWPNSLDLRILHQDPRNGRPSHVPHSSTIKAGEYACYADKFSRLDLEALRNDIAKALVTNNENWPADYGHYGPLMVRLAWHSAGTYRVFDGRGGANAGNIRLAPLNSWPDNASLDKARLHILWPIKQKYGASISWGDLIILAGNVAIETMMGEGPLWFGGGRVDAFAAEEDVFWGHETEWLKDNERGGGEQLKKPLGATEMGLIYVNPEGPGGNPDILASAKDIRITFSRMGMDDVETVALIAGGHTFGKAHGAADPSKYIGAEPEGAPVHEMGLGWKNGYKSGKGADTITSGLEGAWTARPCEWDNGYFNNLFKYDWVQTKSPGGATQWVPSEKSIAENGGITAVQNVPDAHNASKKHLPIMFTTDLATRYDPIYGKISMKFHSNPDEFKDAFKRAWYKLCHRDMGPKSRHLGPWVPKEDLIWMDPIPEGSTIISENDVRELKGKVLTLIHSCELSISDLVKTSWGAISTYRSTDHRGGANGGRIRLEPQRNWAVNDPPTLHKVIAKLEHVQDEFNSSSNTKVSFADLLVLAGNVAIEEATRKAGFGDIKVPFVAGRTDATQSETDVESFNALEPTMDGTRNYEGPADACPKILPEAALLDRAHLLSLTAPELVVLIGGLRVLNANTDNSNTGVLTDHPGVLTNDFFVNLLDMSTTWTPMKGGRLFKGTGRNKSWVASRTDLIFGSNSQLRAISESYASADSPEFFIQDFINAWTKVSMLDRFDVVNQTSNEPRIKL